MTVRVGPEDATSFRLEVQDTGIGIAPEDLEPADCGVPATGWQLPRPKRVPGHRLELALTKRLVVSQGGRVGVRSTRGQGSVFFAVLPRLARATAAVQDPTAARPAARRGREKPSHKEWCRER